MGNKYNRRAKTRTVAFVLLAAIVLGSALPELGNIQAMWLGLEDAHYFNDHYLVGGVSLCLVAMWALVRR